MRGFLLLVFAGCAVGQSPRVEITNISRAGSKDFQVGDRFEIVVSGGANQAVSLRTTRQGQTDWGPVIGWTDLAGKWVWNGEFRKEDFGDWREVWTVGGKLANPVVQFSVAAPCLKGGRGFVAVMGISSMETCDTAQGSSTFGTRSANESLRTVDGRAIEGNMRTDLTAEQYQAQILESFITGGLRDHRVRQAGDEAGATIAKIIGTNALGEEETKNVLAILRAAFEKRMDSYPMATLGLLRNLSEAAEGESLKREIAETAVFVERQ